MTQPGGRWPVLVPALGSHGAWQSQEGLLEEAELDLVSGAGGDLRLAAWDPLRSACTLLSPTEAQS